MSKNENRNESSIIPTIEMIIRVHGREESVLPAKRRECYKQKSGVSESQEVQGTVKVILGQAA